jgi:VanZ family protein
MAFIRTGMASGGVIGSIANERTEDALGAEPPTEPTRAGALTARTGTSSAWLAWAWAAVILGLCWTPRRQMPAGESGYAIPHLDKAVHLLLFTVFGGLARWTGAAGGRTVGILGVGVALAVVSELGQATPWVDRDADAHDALADALGLLLGTWIVAVPGRRRRGDAVGGGAQPDDAEGHPAPGVRGHDGLDVGAEDVGLDQPGRRGRVVGSPPPEGGVSAEATGHEPVA